MTTLEEQVEELFGNDELRSRKFEKKIKQALRTAEKRERDRIVELNSDLNLKIAT